MSPGETSREDVLLDLLTVFSDEWSPSPDERDDYARAILGFLYEWAQTRGVTWPSLDNTLQSAIARLEGMAEGH